MGDPRGGRGGGRRGAFASRGAVALCAAAVLALAVAAAGCGGDSGPSQAETFRQGYSEQRTALNAISDRVGEILQGADGRTDAQILRELQDVERTYSAQLVRLDALDPPAELKGDFAAVARASHLLDDDLLRIADAAGSHDAAGARHATETLVADIAPLQQASSRLVRALRLPATRAEADAGSGAEATDTRAAGASVPGGVIHVDYERPHDADGRFAQQILRLGGTDGIAKGLSHSFVLPNDLTIHAVDGFVGPNYDPSTQTITLSYGFVDYVAQLLRSNFPELRRDEEEYGRELAAVDGFLLMHEFGHALIDAYELPVLGKEEDAADSVATVFLTETVDDGAQYAFDAAKFFHALSARQRRLAPSAYWDEHSLDQQRAYSIVCWIAGSSRENMRHVRGLDLLDDARLQRCPSEYQQKVQAWQSLLRPHVRGDS